VTIYSGGIKAYQQDVRYTNDAILLNRGAYVDFVVKWAGAGVSLDGGWTTVNGVITPVSPVVINSQPQNQVVKPGQNAIFTVGASGTPPLRYQWRRNGVEVAGATSNSYSVANAHPVDSGQQYSVEVSNAAGSVASDVAVLSVEEFPQTATATLTVVNGFVVQATMTFGGFGYTNTPRARIIGGGGIGAEAVAVVSNSVVVAVNILNPGRNYTDPPLMVIAPPSVLEPKVTIAALSLLSFTNLAIGTVYQLELLSGNTVTKVGTPFAAGFSTYEPLIAGPASLDSYRLTQTPAPTQAKAIAQVVNGFVVGAAVSSIGSGYTTNPTVVIRGGGGSNATATATVAGGSVTAITIINPGTGYTNTPAILIALPPASFLPLAGVTQVMEMVLADLSRYDNYQLEFSRSPHGKWSDIDSPFMPTAARLTRRVSVSGDSGFFRVKYLP
jgi:hypothetical protein